MIEAEAHNERTILDYLNKKCWGSVLKYVPVKDLIRTESTCRRWQEVVLRHLRTVHITIDEYEHNRDNTDKRPNICYVKRSSLYNSFERWTEKLGPSVVATYCTGLKSLEVIKENCPNIEALKLTHVQSQAPKQLSRHNLRDHFRFLQRLCLKNCSMSDGCVSQFIADKALEGLQFYYCNSITGLCFKSMNLSKLKSLEIEDCDSIEAEHMLSAFNFLEELTTLTLYGISGEFFQEIQYGLDKMRKLEQLDLNENDVLRGEVCGDQVSRLPRLKHLRLAYQLGDEDIEAVTRCCQELVSLHLDDCRAMSRRSVKLLRKNAGARLTSLKIGQFYYATDDDFVSLIRGCPHLTELEMTGSGELTRRLPARAAAARRAVAPGRDLTLDLSFTNLAGNCFLQNVDGPYPEVLRRKYKGLNIIFLENIF